LPLGYSNVVEVIDIGEDITDFKIGDLVVSNGAHAEVVLVLTDYTKTDLWQLKEMAEGR
tara:strand:- start:1 stop:177 length:177 start_codon:yes stop_codon:yes gene_type:complete